jgi:glutamate 5-kinase
MTLLSMGVVPVINENDAVAIDELKIGDNDTLSAMVASIVEADLLIILSDIEGLYTANPQENPAATLISEVCDITRPSRTWPAALAATRPRRHVHKIQAAKIAVNSGVVMVIASGGAAGW